MHIGKTYDAEKQHVAEAATQKSIYAMPDFPNPRGVSVMLDRRRALVTPSARTGALREPNNAYAELRYHGEATWSLTAVALWRRFLYAPVDQIYIGIERLFYFVTHTESGSRGGEQFRRLS